MGVLLSCQALGKSYGTRCLFENLSFGVDEGERLGVIGPNGSGKTTLLRLLAQLEPPDTGALSVRRQLRWGYVPQEVAFPLGANAQDLLSAALQGEPLDEVERANRIVAVLGRIGFEDAARRAPVETLSGGWRKRVAIARELVRHPDLLLMDEPTNHLDLEGILWLENLLEHAPFACLVVSHDRWFLEHTATRILELNRRYPEGCFSTPGKYSAFLLKREEFLAGQLKTQKALESKVRREVEWLRRGPPARTTKSRARIGEAGRLIGALAEVRNQNAQGAVKLDFVSTGRQANKLLVLKHVVKRLGERSLLADLNLILVPGMKLGVLGANGSGKTTFLRILAGEWEPDAGTLARAERLRVVYFDQNRELLDKDATLRRTLVPDGDMVFFREQPIHVSAWAKRFLFRPDQLEMRVQDLSGGEQARILLARMMLRPADILLLDEPTNDLDIPSLEVLEESLDDFPGAVVLVTHDRFMLQRLATDLLGLDGKGGAHLFTDYAQWERAREESRALEAQAQKDTAPRPATAKDPARKPKKLSFKEQCEWGGMEAAILEGESAVQALQRDIAKPESAGDIRKLQERCQKLSEAQARVEGLYARWIELEEKQR